MTRKDALPLYFAAFGLGVMCWVDWTQEGWQSMPETISLFFYLLFIATLGFLFVDSLKERRVLIQMLRDSHETIRKYGLIVDGFIGKPVEGDEWKRGDL